MIAQVRVAEPWTIWNGLGGALLLLLVLVIAVVAIRVTLRR